MCVWNDSYHIYMCVSLETERTGRERYQGDRDSKVLLTLYPARQNDLTSWLQTAAFPQELWNRVTTLDINHRHGDVVLIIPMAIHEWNST